MKRKTYLKRIFFLTAVALGSALPMVAPAARAESPPPTDVTFGTAPEALPGLLGHTYTSLEYAYVRNKEGAADVLHSYGVLYNSAVSPGLDTGLKYHFITGDDAGIRYRHHEVMASATGYMPLSWAKPFVAGDAGWVVNSTGGVRRDAFAWRATGGIELGARFPLALTPYASYEYTRRYRENLWSYGAKATFHFMDGWSVTFGGNSDENNVAEYRVAFNLHL